VVHALATLAAYLAGQPIGWLFVNTMMAHGDDSYGNGPFRFIAKVVV
jgi:hypothetical protein